ncbi:TPA: heparinase II/III family protein [Enterococcus faecium]|uniref:alginate lyase family protein n=1 Tax=Enterococcus faecium TaxID=1352 RepID=UPI0002A4436A|nr:alginate lyase family protein [Enterococcus faecium]ELB18984.1 hypothetical protein OIQ_03968 [Enterococcus faecium EnGen0025]MBO6335647.1 alginate lyase family protein [Enterococcus faecium]RYJ84266.1 alginate lyase family protein [Enterococcus faecium]
MPDIKKILNTVKYMTLRQWRYRVYYTVRNKLIKRKLNDFDIQEVRLLPLNYCNKVENFNTLNIADDILKNKFATVSQIKVEFKNHVEWDIPEEKYRLVCFKLNSFKWLLDLSDAFNATGNDQYIKKGFELIDDWIINNSERITGDKWNPYVIAERISNWIGFCSQYCAVLNLDVKSYADHICGHAYELKKSFEFQLGANHLLSEAKALIFAGAFLKDDSLYNFGKKILKEEFKEQFLEDGAHYERSISYHVESLQQYFESTVVMNILGDDDVYHFVKILMKPYLFLNAMISVNGEIPLFNDSALDYPFYDAADFLATSEGMFSSIAPNSRRGVYSKRWNTGISKKEKINWHTNGCFVNIGYIHYRFDVNSENYSFFFDGANCGPDYNLGHAHADALSILLSNSKKNIFVDTGVYTYKPGEERNKCRSTKAHNTVEIDNSNSAEIWSAFRVAKRGHSVFEIKENEKNKLHILGQHDGYEKCLKTNAMHTREVIIENNEIIICDSITGQHDCVVRFHVGPECNVCYINDKCCKVDDNIILESSVSLQIRDWEVSSMFGIKQSTKCIEIPFTTLDFNKVTTKIIIR